MSLPVTITKLIEKYPLISEQIEKRELAVILRECQVALASAPPEASVVEFGCFEGTTSLFLQRLIRASGKPLRLHVYDSFAGLPPKTSQDQSPAGEQFQTGQLLASKNRLITHFRQADLPLPTIHKGWFHELQSSEIPDRIIFAFLDGDYYHSIRDSLRLIWPKLTPTAAIVVDDYQNEALPGVARAVNVWLGQHPAQLRVEASLAIIKPYFGRQGL